MFFRDQYWFLSNMYPCAVTVPWGTYKCAETAFHAAKCVNSEDMLQFQNMEGGLENAGRIKRAGRTVTTDLGAWNKFRVPIMEVIARAKFKDPVLAAKLVETKEKIVEDTITWTDKFWGRTNGIGENHLGKILAKVREEIIMENEIDTKEMVKIGITEDGDPTWHEEWIPKMQAGICPAAVIVTKGCLSSKGQAELLAHPEKYVLHATITGLGKTYLERNVPEWRERFQKLVEFCAKGFPKDHVVIRVDPIIPTYNNLLTVQSVDAAKAIITTAFSAGFRRFRYSFADVYAQIGEKFRKVAENRGIKMNIRQAADCSTNNPVVAEFIRFALDMEKKGCTFGACAEADVPRHHKKGCISEDDFILFGIPVSEMMPPGSNPQRQRCMCPANKFELLEHKGQQCPHACLYCYQAARHEGNECQGDCANCKSHCSNETRQLADTADIFETNAEVLVNPVNLCGVMGAGLAKQFADNFPAMLVDYKAECENSGINKDISDKDLDIATDIFCQDGWLNVWQKGDVTVANLATKVHFKRDSYYPLIENSLKLLTAWVCKNKPYSVAIPRLGTGKGHLNWEIVHQMIINAIKDWPTTTKVWIDGEWQRNNKEENNMDKNQDPNNGNKKEEKTMRKITIVSGALNPLDTNRNFRNTYINADDEVKMPNTGVIVVLPPYSITCVMNAIKAQEQVVTVRVKPEHVAALSRALLTAGFEVHVPGPKGAAAPKETKEEPNIFDRAFGAYTVPRTAVVNQYSIGVSEDKEPDYVMVKPVLVTTPVTPVCESTLTGKETWDVTRINSAIRCCGALVINKQHAGVFSVVIDDATALDIEPNFRIGTVAHQKKVITEVVKKMLLQEKKITPQDSVDFRIFYPGKSQTHHIEGNKEGTYFDFSTFCAETQSRVKSMFRKFFEEHATVYHLGVTNRNAEIEQLKADIEAKDAEIVALKAALAAAQSSQAAAPVVKKNKKARRMPSVFNGLNIQALIDKNLSTATVAAMVVEIKQARYDLIAAADGTKAKKAGIPRSFLGCSVTSAIKRGLSFAAFIEEVKASYLGEQDQQDEQNEQDEPVVTGDVTADTGAEDGCEEPAVEATDDPEPQENVSPDANKKEKDNNDDDDPEDPKGDNDPAPKDKAPSKKGSKPRTFNFSGFGFASGKKAIEIVNGKQEKDEQKEHKDPAPEIETAPDIQDKGDNVSTTPNVVLATYEDPNDETWEQWYKTYSDEKFVRDYYEVEVKKPNALQSAQEVAKINKEAFEQAQTNLCCLAGFFFGTDKAAFVKGLSKVCADLRCDVYIKDVIVDNDGNVFVTLPVSMGSNTVTVRLEKHDDKLVSFQE